MQCPSCHKDIPEKLDFCVFCGCRLIQRPEPAPPIEVGPSGLSECPICGRYNPPTETFRCRKCQRPLLCIAHQDLKFLICIECLDVNIDRLVHQFIDWFSNAVNGDGPETALPLCTPSFEGHLRELIREWRDIYTNNRMAGVETAEINYSDGEITKINRLGNGITVETDETWIKILTLSIGNPLQLTHGRECRYDFIYDGHWKLDDIQELTPLYYVPSN